MQRRKGSSIDRFVCAAAVLGAILAGFGTVDAGPGRRAGETRAAAETPEVDWYAIQRDWPLLGIQGRIDWDRILPIGDENPVIACWEPAATRPDFPSELCLAATLPGPPVDLPLITQNRTAFRRDFIDLSGSGTCAGGGSQFSGTGLGPELAYKVRVDQACLLTVTVRMIAELDEGCVPDPEDEDLLPDPFNPWDVALYVIREQPFSDPEEPRPDPCSDPAMECVTVSDGGGIGDSETVVFAAIPEESYYVQVDGYNNDSGYFEIEIAEDTSEGTPTGCKLQRVDP